MLPEAHSAKYAVNLLFASSLAVRVENAMPSVPVWTLPMWYVKIILFLIDEYQMVSISTFGSELEKIKIYLRFTSVEGWGNYRLRRAVSHRAYIHVHVHVLPSPIPSHLYILSCTPCLSNKRETIRNSYLTLYLIRTSQETYSIGVDCVFALLLDAKSSKESRQI